MTPLQAIAFAQAWTKDMEGQTSAHDVSFFHAMKALLDHIGRQRKDVEEITLACQLLLRENKRLLNELQRGNQSGRSLDQGP